MGCPKEKRQILFLNNQNRNETIVNFVTYILFRCGNYVCNIITLKLSLLILLNLRALYFNLLSVAILSYYAIELLNSLHLLVQTSLFYKPRKNIPMDLNWATFQTLDLAKYRNQFVRTHSIQNFSCVLSSSFFQGTNASRHFVTSLNNAIKH